jgi:hypothetical protein
MSLAKETFGLNKTEYKEKLGRIISNHRASSRIIGESADFILRSCRLSSQWQKLAYDPEVKVYLRYVELAGGRRVKMLSLERGTVKQPVSKAKLIDQLYPAKKIATTATLEEKHYNAVKSAMRHAVQSQLKEFRDSVNLPVLCSITNKKIRPGMRTDVDHVGTPFSEIADNFLLSKGLKYTDITLKGPPSAKQFKDQSLWVSWMLFHKENAQYALVCASGNRSKGSGGYATPSELYGSFSKENPEDLSLDF